MSEPSDQPAPERFGFLIGGPDPEQSIRVLIPLRCPSEYVDNVTVFPVPRAPERLRGVVQIRGQAIPVLETAELVPQQLPVIEVTNVLILGAGTTAVALIQARTPCSVAVVNDDDAPAPSLTDATDHNPGHLRAAPFDAALGPSRVDDNGNRWLEIDIDAMVRLCLYGALVPGKMSPGGPETTVDD